MKEKIKVGFIGLGGRGRGVCSDTFADMVDMDVEITAICDAFEDRVTAIADKLESKNIPRPICTTNYKDILNNPEIDAVVILSSWATHVDMAVEAMEKGKYVGLEVGGVYALEDCWRLIDTHERTGSHVMFLENCCFGQRELMTLRMFREGIFGDIVHCSASYSHDLREEIASGKEKRHYRLGNYINRNCDTYPSHDVGPLMKILDINNGNRFVTLSSFSSCAKGLKDYIKRNKPTDDPLQEIEFKQGDVITTVLTCANGETVRLTLDTTLPRFYSREFTVRGTRGSYFGLCDAVFLEDEHKEFEGSGKGCKLYSNGNEFARRYCHPLWKDYVPKGGHGGMDWHVFRAFVESAKKNVRPPVDIYDGVVMMCITVLSEMSIAKGNAAMDVPDFTRGKWYKRRDIDFSGEYNLDRPYKYSDYVF